jgi:hypothetical protein
MIFVERDDSKVRSDHIDVIVIINEIEEFREQQDEFLIIHTS